MMIKRKAIERKTWSAEIVSSGHWSELAFGFWISMEFHPHIVSEDMKRRGRWIGCGLNFLKWRLSVGTMFATQPYL